MTISHTAPHRRLRTVVLTVLAAVGLTMAFSAQAQAHGTCTTDMQGPFKTSAGNIKAKATFNCTHSHRVLTVNVHIERLEQGVWAQVGEEGIGRGSGTSQAAVVVVPCGGTDDYRAVGRGTTGNEDTVSPHIAQNPTFKALIQCSQSDLTNTAALLELATWRLTLA
jgi:hypothetical protein